MAELPKTRRQIILSSAAVVGGIAALAASKTSRAAMQPYALQPTSPLGIAVANRCKVSSEDHASIKAQLAARLAADPSLTTISELCPICGCPIFASR
jgi:hypothetical protein